MACTGACSSAVVPPPLKSYQAINVFDWSRPLQPNAFKPCRPSMGTMPRKGRKRVNAPRATGPDVVVTQGSMGGSTFWRGGGGHSTQAGAPRCCSKRSPLQLPPRPPGAAAPLATRARKSTMGAMAFGFS